MESLYLLLGFRMTCQWFIIVYSHIYIYTHTHTYIYNLLKKSRYTADPWTTRLCIVRVHLNVACYGNIWERVRVEVSLPGSQTLIYCGTTALTLSRSNTAVCTFSKYLYLSALGLHCCSRAFSGCGWARAALELRCSGFSLRWLLLWSTGSRCGFQ